MKNSNIIKGGHKYIPRGDNVFVREGSQEMLFFGRNEKNKITFYVSSEDPTSF